MALLNIYPSYIFRSFQIVSYLSIYEVPETGDKLLKTLPTIHMKTMPKLDMVVKIPLQSSLTVFLRVVSTSRVILSLQNVGTKVALERKLLFKRSLNFQFLFVCGRRHECHGRVEVGGQLCGVDYALQVQVARCMWQVPLHT